MNLAGKTMIVTGATSGIGEITALRLAEMGAQVLIVCRNATRGAAVQQAIRAKGGRAEVFLADFADLDQVRRAAGEISAQYPAIDVLVNNAGLYIGERKLSAQGFEMTFAVNHLATFVFTQGLLAPLRAAKARVVTVASAAHYAGNLNLATIAKRERFNGGAAYCDSKLCNVLFASELARREASYGITSNSLHPGGVRTNFASDTGGIFALFFRLASPFMLTPEQGAKTSIFLASEPSVASATGLYYTECKPRTPSPVARDLTKAKELWQLSEQLAA